MQIRGIVLTLLFSSTAFAATDILVIAQWEENLRSAQQVAAELERNCGGSVVVALSQGGPDQIRKLARNTEARAIVFVGSGVSMPTRTVGVGDMSVGTRGGENPFRNSQFHRESEARQLPYEDQEFRRLRKTLRERNIPFSTVLTRARPSAGALEGSTRLAKATNGLVLSRGESLAQLRCTR